MNFIYQQKLNDLVLCQEIFDSFKAHPNLRQGGVGTSTSGIIIDKEKKDSYDVCLNDNQYLFRRYVDSLKPIIDAYIQKYPACDMYSPWGIAEKINVQFYKPGGAYYSWHTERGGGKGYSAARHLVFMTYLNDVTDAGETEFMNQGLKIAPEQGLTLIWPVDWTYTHRGVISPTQEKAIITGWFSFLE